MQKDSACDLNLSSKTRSLWFDHCILPVQRTGSSNCKKVLSNQIVMKKYFVNLMETKSKFLIHNIFIFSISTIHVTSWQKSWTLIVPLLCFFLYWTFHPSALFDIDLKCDAKCWLTISLHTIVKQTFLIHYLFILLQTDNSKYFLLIIYKLDHNISRRIFVVAIFRNYNQHT